MKRLWTSAGALQLVGRQKRLSALPAEVEQLQQLEQLFLGDNEFTAVPEVVARLPRLFTLELARNPLHEFPDALASRLKLRRLDLSGTGIHALPPSVAQWPLAHLRLEAMPHDFDWAGTLAVLEQIPTLADLWLGRNAFARVPVELYRLRRLRSLYLHECGIRELPAGISALGELHALSLWSNELETVPEEMARMPSLGSLVVSNNPGTRAITSLLKKEAPQVHVH